MDSKTTVFIDVDGTLFDTFKAEDKKIIRKIFGKNPCIAVLDSALWYINGFDIISNSTFFLKVRFVIYMIFSFKKYSYIYRTYENLYKKAFMKSLKKLDKSQIQDFQNRYELHVITNNPFSVEGCVKTFKHVIFAKNTKNRKENIKNIAENDKLDSFYVVGNNYMDDILLAKKLNVTSIYIGKSKVKERFKADYYASSFNEVLDFFLKRD